MVIAPTAPLWIVLGTGSVDQIDRIDIGGEVIIPVVVVLAVAYLIAEATDRFLHSLADNLAAQRFGVLLVIPLLKVGVYAVAAFTVVQITVSPTPRQILAFSGLLGAALGFGFKELVTDVLGGLSILFERPYRMGDRITIGDHYGEVVNIGLRSTQIVTLDDDLVTIPNHVFFTESIVNASAGDAEILVPMDFHVALESDPDEAARLVEEAIITSRYVYVTDDHPVMIRLEDEPYYYTVTAKAYVNDLRNEPQFRTEVTKRTLEAFQEHGIDQPSVTPRVETS